MDLSVRNKFKTYPDEVSEALLVIRALIFQIAKEEGITDLIETLKWAEPSYISKIGTTIRYDWKAKYPNEYRIYFHCQTSLVETFKEVYADTFEYDGNRALIFKLGATLPMKQLSHCLSIALRYKKVKHLKYIKI